ncbi:hypothetical protein CROQUDRAFT_669876 [Cronartium quercuum f. sp. fusiforme G11]|uniref:Uncharacterized protein n=1 Tax=Cronartium quercuum f. sp. fusiforme G11 TaxID=708437 RepID=A0A9P6NQL4_9BASI|nr:hypothetical protein CROQUDRAFT_669876 [Cronartium quercuum f. sp. fusiforme G11]
MGEISGRAASSFTFPTTAQDWSNLRNFLYVKILIPDDETGFWLIFCLVAITGLLYVSSIFRALYLKKYYLVKRDSFGRLCPHTCLLVSFCGIVHVTNIIAKMIMTRFHGENPFPIFKFVMSQFSTWDLYYLAGVRTWSVWCAMPPTVFRLRESKISKWHVHGPSVLIALHVGHFIMFAVTNTPIIRLLSRIEKLWADIRIRLDIIVSQASSPQGITPSPSNFKFESQTIIQLLNLAKDADIMMQKLRIFSAVLLAFITVMLGMFCYASIVILRALNIQLKLVDEAQMRARNLLRERNSFEGFETLTPFESPGSLNESLNKSLVGFRDLSWTNLAVFFRKEKLDYNFLNSSIGEQSMLEQCNIIRKKASCLRRHWWRIFLQLVLVMMCGLSFSALCLCIALNAWNVGKAHFLSEIQSTIDAWKTWTWVCGPGLILAAITCVSEFLDDGTTEPEPESKPKHELDESDSLRSVPMGSFDPFWAPHSPTIEVNLKPQNSPRLQGVRKDGSSPCDLRCSH